MHTPAPKGETPFDLSNFTPVLKRRGTGRPSYMPDDYSGLVVRKNGATFFTPNFSKIFDEGITSLGVFANQKQVFMQFMLGEVTTGYKLTKEPKGVRYRTTVSKNTLARGAYKLIEQRWDGLLFEFDEEVTDKLNRLYARK